MIEVHEVLREPLPAGEQLILPFELRQKTLDGAQGAPYVLILPDAMRAP